MPLGDSITYGYPVKGGYRYPLYLLLTQAGITFDFVGSQTTNPHQKQTDKEHEGHGGRPVAQVVNDKPGIKEGIEGWLAAAQPDVILLMIGTNDVVEFPKTVATAPQRLSELLDQIRGLSPNVKLFVATIPPVNGSENQMVITYNTELKKVVAAKGAATYLVDIYAALYSTPSGNYPVHPDSTGYDKIARTWFAAVEPVLKNPVIVRNSPGFTVRQAPIAGCPQTVTAFPGWFSINGRRIDAAAPAWSLIIKNGAL
jgi:hypothetical protein